MQTSLYCRLWVLLTMFPALLTGCRFGSELEPEPQAAKGENPRPADKQTLDVAFIPDDSYLALVIHPKRIADSPLAGELSEETAAWIFNSMTEDWGFDPRQTSMYAVILGPHELVEKRKEEFFLDEPQAPPWDSGIIMRFTQPIANRELMTKMFRDFRFSDEQSNHEGKSYYLGYWRHLEVAGADETESPADCAVHLPDDRTMVYSMSEPMLKKMLSASESRGGLAQRLRQLDADHDLLMIATTDGARSSITQLKELQEQMPPKARGMFRAPELGQAATLTADLRANPVAQLIVEANTPDGAVELKQLLDETIIETKMLFGDHREGIAENAPPEVGKWIADLLAQVLDGVEVTQDGKHVTGTLTKPAALAKLPEILTSLAEVGRQKDDRLARRVEVPGEVGRVVVYEVDADKVPPATAVSDARMKGLIGAIERRLNYGGSNSGRVRRLDGDRIEVSIYRADPEVMQRIADMLPRPGTLEFRIAANPHDHGELIERARKSDADILNDGDGNRQAWWVPVVAKDENWNIDGEIFTRKVRIDDRQVEEALVVDDEFDVTGPYLKQVVGDVDALGEPFLAFMLNDEGARRMSGLTGSNLPDENGRIIRRVGIIIDGKLLSAPVIRGKVSGEGQINGRFSQEEVQDLVDLLKAGALPLPIRMAD